MDDTECSFRSGGITEDSHDGVWSCGELNDVGVRIGVPPDSTSFTMIPFSIRTICQRRD